MSYYDNSKELDQIADLQATIADLQGQIAVERANKESAVACVDRDVKKISALQQRVAQLSEKVTHYDRWLEKGVYFTTEEYAERVKQREVLEQRVAQLEGENAKWEASCNLVEAVMERNKLKTELTTLQDDHARVLGLVQALPVVRGNYSLTVTITCPTRSMEIADATEALLTYRASLPAQPAQGGA